MHRTRNWGKKDNANKEGFALAMQEFVVRIGHGLGVLGLRATNAGLRVGDQVVVIRASGVGFIWMHSKHNYFDLTCMSITSAKGSRKDFDFLHAWTTS